MHMSAINGATGERSAITQAAPLLDPQYCSFLGRQILDDPSQCSNKRTDCASIPMHSMIVQLFLQTPGILMYEGLVGAGIETLSES